MRYEVSQKSIEDTKSCKHNFECLDGRFDNCSCSISGKLTKNAVSLDVSDGYYSNCSYSFNFGQLINCSCPVRIELYSKYKV